MKYEEPKIDILMFGLKDVITLSVDPEGDGDNYEDDWAK